MSNDSEFNDSEFTGPLFLQPSNPNEAPAPDPVHENAPPPAPDYEGLFSSRP